MHTGPGSTHIGAPQGFAHLAAPPSDDSETLRLQTMLDFEFRLWEQGFACVAGVDEAGRGPLAGPILAAAVVLCAPLAGLNDSKQVSPGQREMLYEQLASGAGHIGVASISASDIDQMGIQQANMKAMRDAVIGLPVVPDYVLVDGFSLSGLVQPTLKLVRGDARSLSIAAASIIAKVARDRYMVELDERYPQYGFIRHKGYGTREHLDALKQYGPCPEHRMSFAPIAQPRDTAFLV